MFIYDLAIFLTSTAFVDTKAKHGIPLSRYTVFLQNCPLAYTPYSVGFFVIAFLRWRRTGGQNRQCDGQRALADAGNILNGQNLFVRHRRFLQLKFMRILYHRKKQK